MVEMALDLRRGGEGGVDQVESARVDPLDRRLEQRIVRAAEHQRVRAEAHDLGEVALERRLGSRRVGVTCLDYVDQLRTGLLKDTDHRVYLFDRMQVLLAAHRPCGGDDPDAVVLGRLDGGLRARADDADDRDLEMLARLVERGRRGGVAGDDDELHVARLEVADDLERKAAHLVLVARPVWEMEQVGQVDRRLVRQPLADRAQYGQSADPRVEDAYRSWITHRRQPREESNGPYRQAVTQARHRVEHDARLGMPRQLASQPLHVGVDRVVVEVVRVAPDLVAQLGAGQHALRVGGEHCDEVELGHGERDLLVADPHASRRVVDLHRSDREQALRTRARRGERRAPQMRVDASSQDARVERLGDVVVRADLEADDLIHLVGAPREHDHRADQALAAQLEDDLGAAYVGQDPVDEDQVRMRGTAQLDGAGPVGRL